MFVATSLGLAALVGCRKPEAVVTVKEDDKAEREKADAELFMKAARIEESAIKVYRTAATLPFIKSDAAVLSTAGRFMAQHAQHREQMVGAAKQFGSADLDPSNAPMPAIPAAVTDASLPEAQRKVAVLRLARKLEMEAAKAYYDYITRSLRTEFGRRLAGDILPVEAQHVALYDYLLQTTPVPVAFFSEQV